MRVIMRFWSKQEAQQRETTQFQDRWASDLVLRAQLAMPSMYSRKHLRHSIAVEEGAMHANEEIDSATAGLDCACCVRHVVHRRSV